MLDSPWPFLLVFAAFVAMLLLLVAAAWPHVFTYRLGDRGFEVRMASLVAIVSIPYGSITEVKKVHALEVWLPRSLEMFNAARAGNRLFARCAVTIRRTRGLRKLVIVTPADPDGFVRELSLRSQAARRG